MAKLELNKETLRELSDTQLAEAVGGEEITKTLTYMTQTPVCPSGATWFQECGNSVNCQ